MQEGTLSSELGLSVDARVRSGAVEYSGAANFLSQSMSDDLSVSAAWESDYVMGVDKLIVGPSDLNETGKKFLNNPDRWNDNCGDTFVNEVVRGAKFFFSIRVDFNSKEDKEAFNARFGVSGPLADASASLKQASQQFSRHAQITVTALQIGGDVSKATQIFDSSGDGQTNFIQCTLGGFEQCAQVIQKALAYVTDTEKGFPSQLAPGVVPGPTALGYRVAPYGTMGVYLENYPGLTEVTKEGRQTVSDLFESNFKDEVTAERLLAEKRLEEDRRERTEVEKQKVDRNLRKILDASQICYDSPLQCWDYVSQHLRPSDLESIDESAFQPLSFEALCALAAGNPPLALAFQRIRDSVGAASTDSCPVLHAKASAVDQMDLSGKDRPEDLLDLRPLETLINLVTLTIEGSKIDDVGPLAPLVNLKALDLQTNRITDVAPLADMMDLIQLNLSHNQIKDVSPLSGMLRIERLFLSANAIDSLGGLTFLPQLTSVDLRLNPLSQKEIDGFRKNMPPAALVQY
jgi:hypothetical protein